MTDLATSYRSHTCGELRIGDEGKRAKLAGWVDVRRDHGGLIFADLRDRYGATQVVFSPERGGPLHQEAGKLRSEFVIQVEGAVRRRPEGTVNLKLPTGQVEIAADSLLILSAAKTPPFALIGEDAGAVSEEARLKHRYVDLRRPSMQEALEARSRATRAVRELLNSQGFLEIETPVLAKSTPEGARDYLVPSRVYPGKFFALPQSPQMFKQLLMVGGCDRYFSIVKCYRDEDLRADRQPEFTQIDLEMSFVGREEIFALVECIMAAAFRDGVGIEIPLPFPRMTYAEAMGRFGSDKPDTRFGMELADVTEIAAASEFKAMKGVIEAGGVVKGLAAPGASRFSRKDLDGLVARAGELGAKGLAWIKMEGDAFAGPVAKFFPADALALLARKTGAKSGDLMIFVADRPKTANAVLGALRVELGRRLGQIPDRRLDFLFIKDFPLFQWDEAEKRFVSEHHPFTAPVAEDMAILESNPGNVRSGSYDLVLNGTECGSGSVRIHDGNLQERIFRVLNLDGPQIEERFGFFIEALKYGTPPHAGVALGVDRIMAIMLGRESIRDVIAFPKTQRAVCPMTGAPSTVDPKQLKELGLPENLGQV